MSSALEINGKLLYPIKDVAKLVSYSRDYITRLAREEKIIAQHVGRQWFIDTDSLHGYIESVVAENEIRKKRLSAERKHERKIRAAVEKQKPLRDKKVRMLHVRAVATACLVLGLGLFGGAVTYQLVLIPSSTVSVSQIANTFGADILQVASTKEYEITSDDIVVATQPSHLISSMGEVKNGIFLLPAGAASSSVQDMFSDEVMVKQLADGSSVVVQVNKAGQVIGSEIPFVMVPVKQTEI